MALAEKQTIRYARNITMKEIGEEGQAKLLHSKVLVIGAGGLGSAALLYLASAGVGNLGVADGDLVELSNLQRQVLHRMKDIGREKKDSAEENLLALDPDLFIHTYRVMTEENVRETVAKYDFVLDCTDSFASKFLINDACVREGKPFCHAGVARFGGQVLTCVPGESPCLRCLMEQEPDEEDCEREGVLGAAAGLLGSMQALECIKCILGIGVPLTGRVLTFDGLNMNVQVTEVPGPNPDCPLCGHAAGGQAGDAEGESHLE